MSNIQTLYDMQSNVGAKLEILMKKIILLKQNCVERQEYQDLLLTKCCQAWLQISRIMRNI